MYYGINILSITKNMKYPEYFDSFGSVTAFQNGKPLHFQELQKRLHKKNLMKQIMSDIPLVYIVYDIMYFNGQNLIRSQLEREKKFYQIYLLKNLSLIQYTNL